MGKKIFGLKDFIWALCIIISLAALFVGFIIAATHKYTGEEFTGRVELSTKAESKPTEEPIAGKGDGTLHTLPETKDYGQDYIDGLTFLCDSAFINLRELGLVGANQVWGSTGGSLSMVDLNTELIKFPNDGSDVSVVNASMVSKPDILLMMLGMDGLTRIDEDTFISNYVTLINDVRANSPDTKIICCSPASISETYSGNDYSVGLVSSATQWIQIVCMKTGAYYLDLGEAVGESFQMLAKYSASNGRSVNRLGLQTCLDYIRTHALLK